jgi:hypothetical protein
MVQARSGSAGLYPQHLRGRGERIEFVASLGYIPRHCLKTHIHKHTHTHTHTQIHREREREREREKERTGFYTTGNQVFKIILIF